MKTRAKQPTRASVHSRDAIAAAVAAILAGGTGQAWAQTAQDQPGLEEVVVTGIRHSIETSIAVKRQSTSVVEVVSAEDIGKLPDTSIADSIARLPGLAAQRIDGRPSQISIRGLGPDYSTALLNGRQVVSSSDGRDAEYDQFPSELVNQVVVYKTVDAGVVGQGLAGTIDIRPLMPLTLEHSQWNFGARGEHNTNGGLSSTGKGPNGSRFSASYVGQFADHTIGWAVGFAHLDSPGQHKQYSAWDYGDYVGQWGAGATGVPAVGAAGDCVPGSVPAGGNCAVFAQGFEANVTSSKQVRDGLMSILEFKPNDNYHSTVDLYYSKFTQDRVGHHWVGDIGLWNGGPPTQPPPADFTNVSTVNVDGNTIIDSGTVNGAHSLVYDKNWNRTDKIFSIGWRNEFNLGSNWKATADVGYSHSDRDELYIQSVARANAYSSFNFANLGSVDNASWETSQDLTDPNLVQLTNDPNYAELRDPKYRDAIKSAQFTLTRDLSWGWFNAIDAGVAYNQRDKSVQSDQFFLQLAGGPEALVSIPTSALRAPVLINVDNISQYILSWDVPSIMNLYTQVPKDPWAAQTNKYGVHEKVTTAFLKLDINTQAGSVPVKGNLGVQVVHSEQNSDGFAWNDAGGSQGAPGSGAVLPVHGGASYYDVLPSLNLVFNLTPDLIMRFGLGKTMARPRMDDMRAGADQPRLAAITSGGNCTAQAPCLAQWQANGGGKPDLKPWRAKSVDLSLEQYFKKRSYVAVAGFLKKLDSFIYQKDTRRDFTGFTNYDPTLTPGCPITETNCNPNIGTLTTQDNGTGGRVYGGELSTSLDGSLVSHSLDGIGLILSYAKTFDKLPLDSNNNPINLDGFSTNVSSIEAYFERGGFAARVSQRYRSSFTATTRGVVLQTQNSTHIDAERQVDAQIGYEFKEGSLKGLSILLQGNNLTNAPAIQRRSPQTVGSAGNPIGLDPWNYDDYGRVILFGATYKL
ncbi:MAG: TonB-dependent receptor [Proteobacteria bacterium]|nr:TonB-dependent receptor [Pseudomonadota bacterium]